MKFFKIEVLLFLFIIVAICCTSAMIFNRSLKDDDLFIIADETIIENKITTLEFRLDILKKEIAKK